MTPKEIMKKFGYNTVSKPDADGISIASMSKHPGTKKITRLKYFFHIKNGQPIYDPVLHMFDEVHPFVNGWARWRIFAGIGYVNKSGIIFKYNRDLLSCSGKDNDKFLTITDFSDKGFAIVTNVYAFTMIIDTHGNLIEIVEKGFEADPVFVLNLRNKYNLL